MQKSYLWFSFHGNIASHSVITIYAAEIAEEVFLIFLQTRQNSWPVSIDAKQLCGYNRN